MWGRVVGPETISSWVTLEGYSWIHLSSWNLLIYHFLRPNKSKRNIMSAFSDISDGDWDVISVFYFIMLSSVLFSPLDTKALAEHQVQLPSDSYLSLIAPSRPCNYMDLNGTWRKANTDVSKAPNIWNPLNSELNLSLQKADHQCTLYVLFVFIHCVNSH